MEENEISRGVVDACLQIHSALGPGLLESVYQACMEQELTARNLPFLSQVVKPVRYRNVSLSIGFRLDMVVAGKVVLEFKTVEALLPVHRAQLLSYLRLGGYRLGLLLNFNTVRMRDGIKRVVNAL